METITTINGNKQPVTKALPKVYIHGFINDVALAHITENTGLVFSPSGFSGYETQPTESNQIVRLLLTYNFKTRYYDNLDYKNTLHLKLDHNIGFDVDSICFDCVKANLIKTNGLQPNDRLAC